MSSSRDGGPHIPHVSRLISFLATEVVKGDGEHWCKARVLDGEDIMGGWMLGSRIVSYVPRMQ